MTAVLNILYEPNRCFVEDCGCWVRLGYNLYTLGSTNQYNQIKVNTCQYNLIKVNTANVIYNNYS